MGSSATSLIAGLAVAVLGAVPAVWLLTAPSEEPAATPTTTKPVITTTVPAPLPEPAPAVAGLSEAIGAVLGDAGAAETVPADALADELPENVVRVLIEHGAVLTVPEESIEEGS